MKKTLVVIGAAVVLVVAYWLISPLWRNVTLDESLPINTNMPPGEATPELVGDRANMIASAHEVEGTAMILRSGGETHLRFENLKTINGPDLRIYLSADLDASDFVDLGKIRATEGNVNYLIPPGTDLKKYKIVMIWCKPFGVLFSYADLGL